MRRYITTIYILSCLISASLAQDSTLLPVKENGKWGFIDINKRWVISPQYDYCIAFDGRDYTWAKNGTENLLINRQGKTLQSLDISGITDIYDDLMVYREEDKIGWYNKDSKVLVPARYTTLHYVSEYRHFIVSDTMGYAVVDAQGNNIVPADAYDLITVNAFYQVSKNRKEGIYSTAGELIIPIVYKAIDHKSPFFITTDSTGLKYIYTYTGDLLYQGAYQNIIPIQENHFQCRKDDVHFLLHAATKVVMDSTSGMYTPLRTGLIEITEDNMKGVYSTTVGRRVIDPEYPNIYSQGGSSHLILYDGTKFSLADTLGVLLNPQSFNSIGELKYGSIVVRNEGFYGLLGAKGKQLLSCDFFHIAVGEDQVAKAKKNTAIYLFEYDENENIIDSMQFNKTGQLRLGGQVTMDYVPGNGNNKQAISALWFQNAKGKWGMRYPSGQTAIKPIYDMVVKLPGTPMVLCRNFVSKTSRFARNLSLNSTQVYALVNEEKYKPIANGLMHVDTSTLSDSSVDVLTVINGGGYFGTVSKKTGRLFQYNSKYIGKFHNGRARIFIGSKFLIVRTVKYCDLGKLAAYCDRFHLTSRGSNRVWTRRIEGIGYWAYIDSEGRFIRDLKYFTKKRIQSASDFSNNRAIITIKDNKYGMLDGEGNEVLRTTYKRIEFVQQTGDSLILTESFEKRYGFVSENGRIVAPVQYTKVLPFQSDHTWCFTDNSTHLLSASGGVVSYSGIRKVSPFYNGLGGIAEVRKLAIIDTTGSELSSYVYSKLGSYSEGLMPARARKYFGYLDDNGEWAIEPRFYKAGPFINGVARVQYTKKYSNGRYYGYINTQGEVLEHKKLNRAENINKDGYALIKKGSGRGVVNASGLVIIKPKYAKIYYGEGYFTTFHNGVTTLRDNTGKKIRSMKGSRVKSGISDGKLVVNRFKKYGVIDVTGKKILPFKYRNLAPFENGISVTNYRNRCYIIYETGDTLASFIGRSKGGFQDGLLLVQSGPKYWYVNSGGVNTFNKIFTDAEPFQDGTAIVRVGDRYGSIDKDGFYRIKPNYDIIRQPTSGVSIVGMYTALGICDLDINYILAPKCSAIKYLANENVFQYTYKNEFGYFDTKGKVLWEVK
jgi:hypothetical protein